MPFFTNHGSQIVHRDALMHHLNFPRASYESKFSLQFYSIDQLMRVKISAILFTQEQLYC